MVSDIFFWLKTFFCIVQYIMFFAAIRRLMPIRCKNAWYWVWAVVTNIANLLFSVILPAGSAIRAVISFIPILVAIFALTEGTAVRKLMMYVSIFLVMLLSEVSMFPIINGREVDDTLGVFGQSVHEYIATMLMFLVVTAALLGIMIILWRRACRENVGTLSQKETLIAAGVPASQLLMMLFWLRFSFMKGLSLQDSLVFVVMVLLCILTDFGVAYIFRSLAERSALIARTQMLDEQLSSKAAYCEELRRQLALASRSLKEAGEKHSLTVLIRGAATVVPVENVLYLERDRYKTNVITTESMLTTTQSPAELLEGGPERQFIRSHQSYWVNRDFITEMEKENFVLATGSRIPISRSCKPAAKEKFLN